MTTATVSDRKAALESRISAECGKACELTIRAEKEYTFSFDGSDFAAAAKIVKFFGTAADCSIRYDEECDMTCVYVKVRY
jgi:hypothetical protein